jgi:hypothetical protein
VILSLWGCSTTPSVPPTRPTCRDTAPTVVAVGTINWPAIPLAQTKGPSFPTLTTDTVARLLIWARMSLIQHKCFSALLRLRLSLVSIDTCIPPEVILLSRAVRRASSVQRPSLRVLSTEPDQHQAQHHDTGQACLGRTPPEDHGADHRAADEEDAGGRGSLQRKDQVSTSGSVKHGRNLRRCIAVVRLELIHVTVAADLCQGE